MLLDNPGGHSKKRGANRDDFPREDQDTSFFSDLHIYLFVSANHRVKPFVHKSPYQTFTPRHSFELRYEFEQIALEEVSKFRA